MTRCKLCGSVLRDHRDPARTRLQAFAEACPEVVEALTIALNEWLWYARIDRRRDLIVENHAEAKLYREYSDLLRRMTAPTTTEET